MNRNLVGILTLLALAIIFGVLGAYGGGFVFLKASGLPTELLTFSTLFDYTMQHWNHLTVQKFLKIGFGVMMLITISPVVLVVIGLVMNKPKRELHGSARFATAAEIKSRGLLFSFKHNQKSEATKSPFTYPDILLGKYKGRFLRWSSNTFILLAAPTRSGKGVGFVIPNLLHYRDSVVVFDPKLENFKITAGFRAKFGQEVFLFSPDNQEFKTHRWNPLGYIRRDAAYRVGDAFTIAQMLYPTKEGMDGNTKFFNEKAQTLFLGLTLFMIETEKEEGAPKTSLGTLVTMTTPKGGLANWINETLETRQAQNKPLSRACVDALMSFAANKSDNTSSGILDSLTAPLNAFRDPFTIIATEDNDFDFREIRKKRMSIYIGVQPGNIAKFSGMLNLFFSQLINENTRELPEENSCLKYQALLMMDEFTALGYVASLEKSIAYMAGYNLRLAFIFQNRSQMNKIYTDHGTQTFFSNTECQIIFPPKETKDSQDYSELIGYQTVKGHSISRSRGRNSSQSKSESDQRRAVMLPQELREMPRTECLINLEGIRIFKATKIVYYSDPVFKDRINLPVPNVPTFKDEIIALSEGERSPTPPEFTPEELYNMSFNNKNISNQEEIINAMVVSLIPNLESADPEYIQAIKKAIIEQFGEAGVNFFDTYAI